MVSLLSFSFGARCFLSAKSSFLFLLQAAAHKCVSVGFLLLEHRASHLSYTQEKTNRTSGFFSCFLFLLCSCNFKESYGWKVSFQKG